MNIDGAIISFEELCFSSAKSATFFLMLFSYIDVVLHAYTSSDTYLYTVGKFR